MELGATICTPRAPRCRQCPVQDHCSAHKCGTQLKRPARPQKKTLPQRDFIALVVCDVDHRVLLRQRPAKGLLAGLWEFPGGQVQTRNDEEARRLLREFTGTRARPTYTDTIAHTFSHFIAQYHAYTVQLRTRGTTRNGELTWINSAELDQHALSTAQRRIARRCSLLE
jgi:A/G-specific adenine glycosylase